MQVLRLGALTPSAEPAVPLALGGPSGAVTVGNFDGVHRGHRALVTAARQEANRRSRPCVALTFDPHPAQVLAPDRAPRRIMTPAQRQEHLAALGVDALAVLPFTRELAAESPEAFVRQALVGRLGALSVVVGEDFRFGAARAGDVPLLRQLGSRLGFDVVAVPAVVEAGSAVSSTRIREALAEGDVETAAALLGRPHFVDGRVVAGQARGRTLGFPTANLASDNEIFPRTGVYAARVLVDFEPGKARRGAPRGGEPGPPAHVRWGRAHGGSPPPGLRRGTLRPIATCFLHGPAPRREAFRRSGGPESPDPGGHPGGAPPAREPGYSPQPAMSELFVETRDIGDVSLIYPRGFINAHTVRLFEAEIERALSAGRFKLVVNCQGLAYIASAGLGAIMGAIEEVRENGGDIRLSELNESVRNIFEILGFNHLYKIYSTELEAVSSFSSSGAPGA